MKGGCSSRSLACLGFLFSCLREGGGGALCSLSLPTLYPVRSFGGQEDQREGRTNEKRASEPTNFSRQARLAWRKVDGCDESTQREASRDPASPRPSPAAHTGAATDSDQRGKETCSFTFLDQCGRHTLPSRFFSPNADTWPGTRSA